MATISVNNTYYMFNVTAANATVGATYTNNAITYTVKKTIAGGTKLYVTGTAGATTSGTTLTKASGTGDATITFSTVESRAHINGITYVAGDTILPLNDRTIDFDESNTTAVGPILVNTQGNKSTLNITNSSTTTPIVVNMSTENSDITGTYFTNTINVSGAWLNIATGTGAAGQTLNFNTLMGGAIDSPPAVMVETGDSRHYQITVGGTPGYFMPFFNCGSGDGLNITPNFDVQAINILTEFYGDLDHGPVFKYDVSTKIATFGNGGVVGTSNGGAVIPNGARVLYPNIHFTSTVYNPTQSSRNQLIGSGGATFNISVAAFSRNWSPFPSIANAGDLTITSVMGHKLTFGAPLIGTTRLTNIISAPDHSLALAGSAYPIQMGSAIGDVYADFLWGVYKTTSTYAPGIQINNTSALKQFSNIWGWGSSTVSGCYPVMLESVLIQSEAPLVIGPIYNIGGLFYFRECDNIHMTELWNSDTAKAVANTLSGQIVAAIGSKNYSVGKIRKLTNGVSGRGNLISADAACYQYCYKDVVYDLQSNGNSIASCSGERGYLANISGSNPRTSLLSSTTGRKNIRLSNIYTNVAQANTSALQGEFYEWQVTSSTGYTATLVYDGQPFQPIWTNTAKTTGRLSITPPSPDKLTSRVTVVSGVLGTDYYYSGAAVYVPNSGVELIYTNEFPIRGITNFTAAVATITHTGFTTNATIEFSFRVNDGTDTSTWTSWYDATTSANWQTALASLSGYTSAKGFFARLRLKTTGASTTRVFNFGNVTCTPDSTWLPPEVGYIPILVSGHVADSCIAMYDNTVPASPVLVKKKILSTTAAETMDLPYDFDAIAKPFKIKLRKAGYGEVISTDSSYQKGKSAPMSQVLYTTIVDAVAAAITSVSVNGATNTVTILSSDTNDNIHQYLQWWGAQVANMEYEIPSVTTDNVNYTSTYNWVVNAGVDITGTFTRTLSGGATLTMGAGATSTGNITHTSGTKVWTRINLTNIVTGSRVQLYNTTTSTELYNDVPGTDLSYQQDWVSNDTIRYRVAKQDLATAKEFIEGTDTFVNTGLFIKITQLDDTTYNTNAVDGSTVTGITIIPSPARVKMNIAGGAIPWKDIYAYQVYWLTTATGIADEAAFIEAPDTANYILTNFDIRNDSTTPLTITGGWGKDSVTNTIAGVIDVAGSAGNIYAEPDHIIPYGTSGSGRTVIRI